MEALLRELQKANNQQSAPKPILLKIAPDLTNTQLDDIIEIANNTQLSGIIATNTTIDREGLKEPKLSLEQIGAGGLSGAPIFKRSTEIIQYLRSQNPDIPIIAVGGILTGDDALEKLKAGASLVQVYTGLVYKGPALVKEINQTILKNA